MRYFLSTLCFLCFLSVSASDILPVAVWSMGPGTIAGSTAQPQHAVFPGQIMVSSSTAPARLEFMSPVVGHITISPGSEIKLRVEQNDGQQLILDVLQGAVQVQLDHKGEYVAMHVRGGALDVRVTGTLFVVERVRRDADYVALIQGKLKVGLKKDVADALGKDGQLELESRQGVGGDSSGGLGALQGLNNRPQIASASRSSIQNQATGPLVGDGGWDDDMALSFLLDLLEQLGLDEAILAQFTDALGEALFDDLNTGPVEEILSTAFGSAGVLGSPPPPPPFSP